jgi:cytochrome c
MRMAIIPAALLLLIATNAQAGDPNRGKVTFGQCSGCHKVVANTSDSMGPNLFGIVGRRVGSKASYDYSDAMKAAGFSWTHDKLKAFIMDPDSVVPRSNMMFMGIKNPTQAEDVVAYLETLK